MRDASRVPHAMSAPAVPPSPPDETEARRQARLWSVVGEGVWEHELTSGRTWHSPRCRELLGDDLADEPGALRQRVPADDQPRYDALLRAAARARHPVEARLRLRSRDGSLRWYQLRLRGGAGHLTGSLRETDTDPARAIFLSHISHELRTPLNAVLGMTELAQRLATHNEQRGYLDLAQDSGQALLRLLDDMIDYARAEGGALALRDDSFDLAQLLAETFRSFMPQAGGRPIAMMFDYLGEQTQFRGDPARVRQIVTELLANALKFTASGHVALVTQVLPQPQGRSLVRIQVQDSGAGMDEATRTRVFEPFEQGDTGPRRRHGGAGLGLSIARKLALLMGGELGVTSVAGQGSVFTAKLMLPPDAQAPWPDLEPGHAWLLCRSETLARWLQRRLERLGWNAEQLPDVAAALDRARRATRLPHSVVLADDGPIDAGELEALRRALPGPTRMTLLLRPDFQVEPLLERATRARVAVRLMPLTPADLRTIASPEDPEPGPPPASPMRPGMHVLVVEDNALNQLIAREMLMVLGMKVSVADSGEAALSACLREPPDLVLMDIQMPGMDGVETTRRLRALQAEGRLPAFPIVALTAHALASDRQSSLDAGMDEHLTKPMQFETLRTVLDQWRNDDQPLKDDAEDQPSAN